jgi:hypothetical protein
MNAIANDKSRRGGGRKTLKRKGIRGARRDQAPAGDFWVKECCVLTSNLEIPDLLIR